MAADSALCLILLHVLLLRPDGRTAQHVQGVELQQPSLMDEATDEILGVHMIGPRTADMIAEAVVAMEYRASAEDISRMSHAHPTFTESMKEACLDATGKRAIHI